MDPSSPFIQSVLEQPGVVVLPGNLGYVRNFIGSGGRVQVQPSGHLIFYGSDYQRFLMTDPEGNPLHECEWGHDVDGHIRLMAARLHLEWGAWVGIRPEGLVNSTVLDLSTRPGWERLTQDDLRRMAARAMNVSFEQIRFFYRDEDLVIDQSGRATIRQRKDAFYVLHKGQFEGARFMSCMSRMHWQRIDYLPVVELFLSLLPGTGSATFELIRGLYDDQNPNDPLPLHYRGIPVYPSEGAFRLFSQFFTGSIPGSSKDPLSVFLDPRTSEEVTWLPSLNAPLRYFDSANKLCVTVKGGEIQKVTLADDPSGLPYFRAPVQGIAPFGQSVTVNSGNLVVSNGQKTREYPIKDSWGIKSRTQQTPTPHNFPTWHQLFPETPPNLKSGEGFSTALLYPENESLIGEIESQPFAFDYFDDLLDENSDFKSHLGSANHIIISQCDAGVGSCLRFDRQRNVTILYSYSPLAQKQAQNLWNTLARGQKLSWLDSICFLPHSAHWQTCLKKVYDMAFIWIPFAHYQDPQRLAQMVHDINTLLRPGGLALIGGPSHFEEHAFRHHFDPIYRELVSALPTFRLHRAILPQARIHPDLMVFVIRKNS